MDPSSQTTKLSPSTLMASAPLKRPACPSQLPSKHRRHLLMKSRRSVLPQTATCTCPHTEYPYSAIPSSLYSQAMLYSPYILDYNPYNYFNPEQFIPWSTAASPAIMTALQPISLVDSTLIVPQMYPILSPPPLMVSSQGTICPHYNSWVWKRRRRPRPCHHENCNDENEPTVPTGATRSEECWNVNLIEDADLSNNTTNCRTDETTEPKNPVDSMKSDSESALDAYFELPAELFHSPRELQIIDPNEIIDHMCAAETSALDMMWLLDLELGHPKNSSTKSFASYDVQSNLITLRDSPTAMHPGFAKCSEEFRKTLLFYYDSIISSWYLGFITYYGDYSVTRFQEWLTRIMDAFGMSWR